MSAGFSSSQAVYACILLFPLALCIYSLVSWKVRCGGRPLPPGPRRLPVVGNILQIPKAKPWLGFRNLCNRYGHIVYLRTLGQNYIILGSAAVVSKVLEERTANTSDRLVGPMVKLSGHDWMITLMPYGQRWRDHRRALWQQFHPGAITRYHPIQAAIIPLFLKKLLQEPERLTNHIRFTFSATMLKLLYGIDIDDDSHEIVRILSENVEGVSQAFAPGKYLVDYIPWLEYLPSWFPGTGYQRQFKIWKAAQTLLKNIPFEQRSIADEHLTVVDELLKRRHNTDLHSWEELVKCVAGVVFEAGADTSFSTMQAVFLALSLNMDMQIKAQAELDEIVGRARLPNCDDLDSLVYVQAILKEALRWHPAIPLGVPHRTMKDDMIFGYFVPAGTAIITNIWGCLHDPEVYENPDDFCPERFIDHGVLRTDIPDPSDIVFGSGRRICPGRYLAKSSLLLNIAAVLHVFSISPPLNNSGQPQLIKYLMTDGFLSYPEDCRCTIKPRFSDASALIANSLEKFSSY